MLELESSNVKALYRRAQAYIQLADLDLAEFDIKKALDIDPNNRYELSSFSSMLNIQLLGRFFSSYSIDIVDNIRDVKLEYKTLKEKVKEYNKKDAKFYGNMFAKMKKVESA